MRMMLHIGVLAALIGALSACNTVQGVGQDIRSAGSAITKAAEK